MGGKVGHPTDYREEYDEQAYKLCLLGCTDKELGTFFEVTETTINNWKLSHISFFESIKRGKAIADMEVAKSLYDQALGYHYEEVTESIGENGKMTFNNKRFATKDFRATRFWLMNRQPEKWRDKTEVDLTTITPPVDYSKLSDAALNEITKARSESGVG